MNVAQMLMNEICVIAFQFDDGSVVTSRTTLNPQILQEQGLQDLDGLVDLDERKIIPEYMFAYYVGVEHEGSLELSPIQEPFNQGGKVSW